MSKPDFTSPTYAGRAKAEYREGHTFPVTLHLTMEAAEAVAEVFGRIQRTTKECADGLYDIDHDIYNRLADVIDFSNNNYRSGISR
jgi:hypothetical protein